MRIEAGPLASNCKPLYPASRSREPGARRAPSAPPLQMIPRRIRLTRPADAFRIVGVDVDFEGVGALDAGRVHVVDGHRHDEHGVVRVQVGLGGAAGRQAAECEGDGPLILARRWGWRDGGVGLVAAAFRPPPRTNDSPSTAAWQPVASTTPLRRRIRRERAGIAVHRSAGIGDTGRSRRRAR